MTSRCVKDFGKTTENYCTVKGRITCSTKKPTQQQEGCYCIVILSIEGGGQTPELMELYHTIKLSHSIHTAFACME